MAIRGFFRKKYCQRVIFSVFAIFCIAAAFSAHAAAHKKSDAPFIPAPPYCWLEQDMAHPRVKRSNKDIVRVFTLYVAGAPYPATQPQSIYTLRNTRDPDLPAGIPVLAYDPEIFSENGHWKILIRTWGTSIADIYLKSGVETGKTANASASREDGSMYTHSRTFIWSKRSIEKKLPATTVLKHWPSLSIGSESIYNYARTSEPLALRIYLPEADQIPQRQDTALFWLDDALHGLASLRLTVTETARSTGHAPAPGSLLESVYTPMEDIVLPDYAV